MSVQSSLHLFSQIIRRPARGSLPALVASPADSDDVYSGFDSDDSDVHNENEGTNTAAAVMKKSTTLVTSATMAMSELTMTIMLMSFLDSKASMFR